MEKLCVALIGCWLLMAATIVSTDMVHEQEERVPALAGQEVASGSNEQSAPINSSSPPAEVEQDICRMPPLTPGGNNACLGYFLMWTYNATEEKCVQYVYGGCRGSANLFPNETLCHAACAKKQNSPSARLETGQLQGRSSSSESVEQAKSPVGKAACSLPVDSGPCYALHFKYAFNQANGRCEVFPYGGCQGNENRFDTPQACQETCGGSEPMTDRECSKKKCAWGLWSHYEIRNCTPVYERGECCPTRFDCPAETKPAEPGCLYEGKIYPIGAPMPVVTESEPCQASCRCDADYLHPGIARVTCASVECPDLFGAPGTRGCKKIHDSLSQCCATSYNCNKTFEANDYLCEYDGRQFLKGEFIYPNRELGVTCHCSEAFVKEGAGEQSSACRKVKCGWESVYQDRLQRGCTPVYFGDGGCPIDWVCPGDKGQKVDNLPIKPRSVEPTPLDSQPAGVVTKPEPAAGSDAVSTETQGNSGLAGAGSSSESRPAAAQASGNAPPSRPRPNICTLPKKAGDCEALVESWYYNAIDGACEKFNYGGCKGNENRFATKEACETACNGTAPGCSLTPEKGMCRARVVAWHFDPETKECKKFFYGGCGGNQNNFRTVETCETSCKNKEIPSADRTPKALESTSQTQGLEGGFTSEITSTETGVVSDVMSSTPAVFGPISTEDPNITKELTIPEVLMKELDKEADQSVICSMPMYRGPCYAAMPRFYFDKEVGQCKMFRFGGCDGNRNNFLTEEECVSTCGWSNVPQDTKKSAQEDAAVNTIEDTKQVSAPSSPPENPVDPSEEKAIHQIPIQSDNDLSSSAILPTTTSLPSAPATPPQPSQDPCSLPVVKGPCRARAPRFYFDAATGQCAGFFYGGCRGNANNFRSLQQCQDKCMPAAPRGVMKEARCYLPEEAGPCKMMQKRFMFDEDLGRCRAFNYGGCRGNRNRFSSMRACQAACAGEDRPEMEELEPAKASAEARKNNAKASMARKTEDLEPCFQPVVAGPCRMYYQQWHYDVKEGKCKPFDFGGCLGNANRFPTEEACANACAKRALEVKDNQGNPLQCSLGKETFRLGQGFLPESNSCYQCQCSTPPMLTCQEVSRLCPSSPAPEYSPKYTPGKCCPTYELESTISATKRR